MAHRAQQIIEQIAALLEANANLRAHVFTHRVFSMAEDQDEMPAVSITYGDDQPQTDNLAFIDSALTARILVFAVNADEGPLREALLEMRRQVHISLLADHTLGLDFVSDCRYGGALEPQIVATDQLAGALETRWLIVYRMNRTDPE